MSLRELEDFCINDVRCRAIMQNNEPSYKTFERFINNILKDTIENIFKEIYLYIQDEEALTKSIIYVDGTKFETNSNKMQFFWKAWHKNTILITG